MLNARPKRRDVDWLRNSNAAVKASRTHPNPEPPISDDGCLPNPMRGLIEHSIYDGLVRTPSDAIP